MPKKRRTHDIAAATEHATRDATVNIRSGANAYYAIHKLPTISSGSVSSNVSADAWPFASVYKGYAPSMPYLAIPSLLPVRVWFPHANEAPRVHHLPPTTHRQLHGCRVLRELYDLGEQAEVGLERG